MRRHVFTAVATLIFFSGLFANAQQLKVVPPEQGAYFGAYADFGPVETEVTEEKIQAFEALSGKKSAWVYFSNHWFDGNIIFPASAIEACRKKNVIPYIRFSPWSEMEQNQKDPLTSMQKIIDGKFDDQLFAWAKQASQTQMAIMMEFGPEVNGDWFPWNGKWNGGSQRSGYGDPGIPDGPERFRDAYRRVIDIFRRAGAHNITWILHLDTAKVPDAEWNSAKYYYPGDDYIDWIGLSVFGRQLPQNNWLVFPQRVKKFLPEIEEMTINKPLLISEFAVIEDESDKNRKAVWLKQAFQSVSKGLFKNVKGMTYWNSPGWLASGKANFKLDSSPAALKAYQEEIQNPFWLSDVVISEK